MKTWEKTDYKDGDYGLYIQINPDGIRYSVYAVSENKKEAYYIQTYSTREEAIKRCEGCSVFADSRK